jgi:hypothetical protein
MSDIHVPHLGWSPRPHQMKLWTYLQTGGKRAMAVWHRRAGKDEICMHHAAVSMIERVGNYWHMLPEFEHARRAIWNSINAHTGKRRIDEAFPAEIRESTNDQQMLIRLVNGSTFQLIASDRFNAIVGSSAVGVTFSEYALSNPAAWGYIKPMIEENDGWAVFITTPRGRNHAKTLFDHARKSNEWYCELLTAKTTGALTQAQLEEVRAEYIALHGADVGRAQYEQEYLCNWNAAILGAYYALEMQEVRDEGRIFEIDALPNEYVHRAWDIGTKDDTSIIWFQVAPSGQINILDHYANSQVGLDHYVDVIREREAEHGWRHGHDYVPHDIKVKEWIVGKTRIDAMRELGMKPMLAPFAKVQDGINAARRTLPFCVFHPRTETTLVAALEQYCRKWDDEKKAFLPTDVHDWTSHPADSFRYLALAWQHVPRRVRPEPKRQGFFIPPPPMYMPHRGIQL